MYGEYCEVQIQNRGMKTHLSNLQPDDMDDLIDDNHDTIVGQFIVEIEKRNGKFACQRGVVVVGAIVAAMFVGLMLVVTGINMW